MRIAELFYSVQGEGGLVGAPSVFVRVAGCNLHCVWCDTPYAAWKPEAEELTVAQMVARTRDLAPPKAPRYVVVTGGEPLLYAETVELTRRFACEGWHVTVETAGTLYQPVHCDLLSISPKLANSTPWSGENRRYAAAHEQHRLHLPTLRRLLDEYAYQLKFVVVAPGDVDEVEALLVRLPDVDRRRVYLMPEGADAATLAQRRDWVVRLCQERGFRYGPRLHIELFGNVRGR